MGRRIIISLMLFVATVIAGSAESYRGFVDVGYGGLVGTSFSEDGHHAMGSLKGIGFSTTHGVQISRLFFVGAGIGANLTDSYERSGWYEDGDANWYVCGRYDLNLLAKVTPYLVVKVGQYFYNSSSGAIKPTGKLFFQPAIGVRFRLTHHLGLNLGLSYHKSTYEYECTYFEDGYVTEHSKAKGHKLLFNIGIDF